MDLALHTALDESLRSDWNSLLAESIVHVPFLRFEYLKAWWDTRGGGEWPQSAQLVIVTAREEGRLIGILPLFFSEWESQPSLLLLGSLEISDYLDVLARPNDLERFLNAALAYLLDPTSGIPAWQRLELYNVLETSPSVAALQTAAQAAALAYHCEPFRPSLSIALPGDWETYLAGIDKKQRHEIRRKMRRASSGEQPVRWYYVQNAEVLDQEIDAFLALMEQDPEKAAFLTPQMRENFRATMRWAYEAGCLHLSFLEVGGKKAAAYYCFDYLDQLWVYNSGMDRGFNDYSPGWVLLGELLLWANENGRKAFDFMRGDEDYKYRFGAQKRDVLRITLSKTS